MLSLNESFIGHSMVSPIRNEECLVEIDYDRYPSIEQFSIICALLVDLNISLNADAEKRLEGSEY